MPDSRAHFRGASWRRSQDGERRAEHRVRATRRLPWTAHIFASRIAQNGARQRCRRGRAQTGEIRAEEFKPGRASLADPAWPLHMHRAPAEMSRMRDSRPVRVSRHQAMSGAAPTLLAAGDYSGSPPVCSIKSRDERASSWDRRVGRSIGRSQPLTRAGRDRRGTGRGCIRNTTRCSGASRTRRVREQLRPPRPATSIVCTCHSKAHLADGGNKPRDRPASRHSARSSSGCARRAVTDTARCTPRSNAWA